VLVPEDWKWTGQRTADAMLKPGDVILVHLGDKMEGTARKATLEQDSGAQASLMAVDNTSGDVLAMVGGRDYALSQFNRATQAERQTGSSFKPYVYTAAVEAGAKPDDTIVDEPVSFGSYTPHNYEGDYKGRMTLTSAFAESRNIPALKLADRVGIHKVIDMAHRFGVTSNIPAYLPVALGAVEITLAEQVASYSVFPNDGLRVRPRLIRKVENSDGVTLWEEPSGVDNVVSQQTARTMLTLLEAVTAHGTGAAAAQLKHALGGKTGTTSDYTDAWFLGFSPSITCGVWVGYDSNQSLGDKETGARAALPIWMDVMRVAIVGRDGEKFLADQPGNTLMNTFVPPPTVPQPMVRPGVATPATAAPVTATSGTAKPGILHASVKPQGTLPSNGSRAKAPSPNFTANLPATPPQPPPPPAFKPPAPPAARPATQATASVPSKGPHIRSAFAPQMSPVKLNGTVKSVITPPKPLSSPGSPTAIGKAPSQAVPAAQLLSTGGAAKPPAQAVSKPPLMPADGSPSAKSHVKTALAQPPAPAKQKAAVKPALGSAPAAKKTKDTQ
jgi:penicillin-binding protein 1A